MSTSLHLEEYIAERLWFVGYADDNIRLRYGSNGASGDFEIRVVFAQGIHGDPFIIGIAVHVGFRLVVHNALLQSGTQILGLLKNPEKPFVFVIGEVILFGFQETAFPFFTGFIKKCPDHIARMLYQASQAPQSTAQNADSGYIASACRFYRQPEDRRLLYSRSIRQSPQ